MQDLTESFPGAEGFSYRNFQLPTAIIFAVTGISRATALVTDIQTGYFDRLLLSPVRRLPLLLGLMVADFMLVVALCIPVMILVGARGVVWHRHRRGGRVHLDRRIVGVGLHRLPYAIALKTANPGAVASSFMLFFPFAFLTSSTVPLENLTGLDAYHRPLQSDHLCARRYAIVAERRLGLVGHRPGNAGDRDARGGQQTMAMLALRGRLARN